MAGASASGSKNKAKSVSSSTNNLDPYMDELRRLYGESAIGAANGAAPTMDGSIGQAQGIYGQMSNLGMRGANALAGDQAATDALMNPYQQNVIDQTSAQFGRLRNQAGMDVNQMATKAGAFGGSRHGVATGTALGQLYAQEGQTIAGLKQTGFNDAMQRAGGLANLGMGATGSMAGLGQYISQWNADNDPAMRRFNILGQGIGNMPYTVNNKSRGTQTGYGIQAGYRGPGVK